jgi:hypothetical protein
VASENVERIVRRQARSEYEHRGLFLFEVPQSVFGARCFDDAEGLKQSII